MKSLLATLFLITIITSCSKNINYSPEHIKQTSGRYLLNQNEVMDVYYDDNDLFISWKGASKKPVVLDEQTFFVADMYKKLRFVEQPITNKRFLGVVSEDDDTKVSYDYPKVEDTYETPRMHFTNGNYAEATAGFLELQKQDSTKIHIQEQEVNRIGYDLLVKKDFKKAIAVLQMNVALYPDSDNVYDSLADAYLRSGDSLQAYTNYKKAYDLNTGNKRAKEYLDTYDKK